MADAATQLIAQIWDGVHARGTTHTTPEEFSVSPMGITSYAMFIRNADGTCLRVVVAEVKGSVWANALARQIAQKREGVMHALEGKD